MWIQNGVGGAAHLALPSEARVGRLTELARGRDFGRGEALRRTRTPPRQTPSTYTVCTLTGRGVCSTEIGMPWSWQASCALSRPNCRRRVQGKEEGSHPAALASVCSAITRALHWVRPYARDTLLKMPIPAYTHWAAHHRRWRSRSCRSRCSRAEGGGLRCDGGRSAPTLRMSRAGTRRETPPTRRARS
jgi:hypothetical protein